MRDVFGSKPNKQNLKRFFSQIAIQALWWPIVAIDKAISHSEQSQLFQESTELAEFIERRRDPEDKKKIIQYFRSLEPEQDFFPFSSWMWCVRQDVLDP